eukprot:scaffold1313_cov250-Pinguiococcus_pyrenoidosus.AAC.18
MLMAAGTRRNRECLSSSGQPKGVREKARTDKDSADAIVALAGRVARRREVAECIENQERHGPLRPGRQEIVGCHDERPHDQIHQHEADSHDGAHEKLSDAPPLEEHRQDGQGEPSPGLEHLEPPHLGLVRLDEKAKIVDVPEHRLQPELKEGRPVVVISHILPELPVVVHAPAKGQSVDDRVGPSGQRETVIGRLRRANGTQPAPGQEPKGALEVLQLEVSEQRVDRVLVVRHVLMQRIRGLGELDQDVLHLRQPVQALRKRQARLGGAPHKQEVVEEGDTDGIHRDHRACVRFVQVVPIRVALDAVVRDQVRRVRFGLVCRVQRLAKEGVAAQRRRDRQCHKRDRQHQVGRRLRELVGLHQVLYHQEHQEKANRAQRRRQEPIEVVYVQIAVSEDPAEHVYGNEAEDVHESSKARRLWQRKAQDRDLLQL